MVLITKPRYKKIIDFCKDNTSLKKELNEYHNTWYEYRCFKCPCCDFVSRNGVAWEKDKYILEGFRGYILHLNCQIRLHASQLHIELWEYFFGREITNEFLRLAIAKNKVVTKELERIYGDRLTQLTGVKKDV